MRSKILAAMLATAATLAAATVADAGTMHPALGARLAGMGEHGIVNLESHARTNRLCWKFELSLMHPLGATIRDAHGMIVARLGHMYSARGCATVPKTSLELIEAKPGSFSVWVATKGHPGDVRGKLFVGMAHM